MDVQFRESQSARSLVVKEKEVQQKSLQLLSTHVEKVRKLPTRTDWPCGLMPRPFFFAHFSFSSPGSRLSQVRLQEHSRSGEYLLWKRGFAWKSRSSVRSTCRYLAKASGSGRFENTREDQLFPSFYSESVSQFRTLLLRVFQNLNLGFKIGDLAVFQFQNTFNLRDVIFPCRQF